MTRPTQNDPRERPAPAERDPMTAAELRELLLGLGISQAALARRIAAVGGRPFSHYTIRGYLAGRDVPAIFAAYLRLLKSPLEKGKKS